MESNKTTVAQELETTTPVEIIKELSMVVSRTDITVNINSVGGSKIKPETLLYNLNKFVNKSDITYVDYTKGGTGGHKLIPINSMFSDNIILYYFIDKEQIVTNKILQDFLKKAITGKGSSTRINKDSKTLEEEPKLEISEDEEDYTERQKLLNVCKQFLPENTQKIKRLFNTMGLDISKADIKPTTIKAIGSDLAQLVKVDLANCSCKNVLKMLESKEVLNVMESEGIFIHDIDFTRDFQGVFNKAKLIQYLLSQGFGFQYKKFGNPTILDNNHLVGRNCLTFIETTDNGDVRYKFYNKFVQSMESPGVRAVVGNHFTDWCNNPEKELKKAIYKSLETGLLRLEITFYRYNTKELLTREFIEDRMSFLSNLIPQDLLFYNPISAQWQLLLNSIPYNICFVDTDKQLAFISLYLNKETGKTNGFYVKNVTSNKVNNILKLYTFNTPIVLVLLKLVGDNLQIQQDTYIKTLLEKKNPGQQSHITRIDTYRLPELTTLATTGDKFFFSATATTEEKQPPDVGIVDCPKCSLRIATGKNDVARKSTAKVNIGFTAFEFPMLDFPHLGDTVRKVNRETLQEAKMVDFLENKQNVLQEIEAKNKELEKRQAITDKLAKIKNRIDFLFRSPVGNYKKLVDIPDATVLYVFAFKEITTKFGLQKIILCSENPTITERTCLSLLRASGDLASIFWANTEITTYIEDKKSYWKQLDKCLYGSLSGLPIFKFKKVGFYYNTSRNICARIQIIAGRTNLREEESKGQHIEDISVNVKNCVKLEALIKEGKLAEGDIITITGKRELAKSVIIRFILKNNKMFAIANFWLKQLMEQHKKHYQEQSTEPFLVCVIGPEKRSQNNTNEHTILVTNLTDNNLEGNLPVDETSQ